MNHIIFILFKKGKSSRLRKNNLYLLLILIGLSVIPVLILGGLSISYFNNYVRNQLSQSYISRLEQFRSELDFQLEDINEAVNTLIMATSHIEMDKINDGNIADFEVIEQVYSIWDLMTTLRGTSRFIHSIYYLNNDGSFIFSSDYSDKTAGDFSDFPDRSWAENLSGSEGFNELSPRTMNNSTDESFPVITRIFNTSWFLTSSEGVFVVNISIDELNRWIDGLTDNSSEDFALFNQRGELIAGGDREEQRLSESHFSEGAYYFKSDSENGWTYQLKVSSALFNSFIVRTFLLMLLMIGILLLLVLLFSFYISDRLYSPIENVISIIDEVAEVPDDRSELLFVGDVFLKILQEQAGLKTVLENNSQAIKESMLRKLFLGGTVDGDKVLDRLYGEESRRENSLFCSAVVLLLPSGGDISVSDSGPAQAMAVRAYEAESSGPIRILGTPLDMERITLLISCSTREDLESVLLKVRNFLESSLSMEPLVAIGGLYDSLDDMDDSFHEALDLLDSTIPSENKQIIYYSEEEDHADEQSAGDYPWAVEAQLIQTIKQGDKRRTEALIGEFLSEVSPAGMTSREQVELAVLSLISAIIRALGRHPEPGNCYRDLLNHDSSLAEAESWLIGFAGAYMAEGSGTDSREEKYRAMIHDYIRDNYDKDISLEHIADWMGISYSYLRKIFSTLFGSTFLDYLHSIRIDKAKTLLKDTNQGISDIAGSVGYTNTSRLNRNFNKIMGCTPSEYRIRVRKSLSG